MAYLKIDPEELPNGIYTVKTDKGREFEVELFMNNWMEYTTPILEDEKVTHIKI